MTSVQLRVLVICFLATNIGSGLTYGTLGPLLTSTEQTFHVSRAAASLGMSFSGLAVSIFGPLVGLWMQRASVRMIMFGGAIVSALAFLAQAFVPSFPLALALYLLASTAALASSILGPIALASRWFPESRGKAIAFVNIPVMTAAAPLIILAARPLGRAAIMEGIAAAMVLLALLLLLLPREAPQPRKTAAAPAARKGDVTWGSLCLNPYFWLTCMAIGIMLSAGAVFLIHAIPFGIERGLTLAQASGLLTTETAAGLFGLMVVGWLADKIGPPKTIALVAFAEALAWWGMLHVHGLLLFVLAGVIGVGITSTITLQGAALAALFGSENVPSAMGLSQLVKLPLTFAAAPLAALLMTATHSYRVPVLAMAAVVGLAAVLSLATLPAPKPAPAVKSAPA